MEKSAQILGEKSGKPLLTNPTIKWPRSEDPFERAGASERTFRVAGCANGSAGALAGALDLCAPVLLV